MATSDQPYKVGDHITYRDYLGVEQSGTIVATVQQVMLDGSQTAYTVNPDGSTFGLVGIAHTDVTGVEIATTAAAAEQAPTETAASESADPSESPATVAEEE